VQTSGKYQPRIDQLKEVAPFIIEMGCFDHLETNGGVFLNKISLCTVKTSPCNG